MEKKVYKKPELVKIDFDSKNAVLGFCHSSPNMWPQDTVTQCQIPMVGCATNVE